ncbi:HAD family hydrolase [Subtercola frigoramans]|uniref:FMN phosphatase YigB (HAD superfamily) n=1 Tax=Subtercola frigoramans TaxID=120298 RepID=A0ABS2L7D1_9MICO|nr:HAD family hydrolase [Subtercola frigoramans]MBM7472987.1 FMN phosphatase YigB (HAD superfamily) [Subtercola frigoramans]
MTTTSRILVLDFDGTVCLGDGPVFSYARLLDKSLGHEAIFEHHASEVQVPGEPDSGLPPHRHGLIRAAVGAYLDGSQGPARAESPMEGPRGGDVLPALLDALALVAGSADGYAAAERLARASGITDAELSAAYAGSRDELASGMIETYAPAGLGELLAGLPEQVHVVLVTNAPRNGVEQQLETLGLAGFFDELVTSAGKPAGMRAILEGLLEAHDLADSPQRLLSVGDIWRNDLEPAVALGCETALIERFAARDARPTYRAPLIEQLYPAITAWATSF